MNLPSLLLSNHFRRRHWPLWVQVGEAKIGAISRRIVWLRAL